ncbi:MAG: GH1 family beta-glucosidase [Candidatus Nanopelagicales bacterium]|jgi:beta-glucosidase
MTGALPAWVPGQPATDADGRRAAAFPDGFLWGTATASYQIEGSVDADGRGPSIWDTFSHTPGKVVGDENGDVACDHYRLMPDDVALMGRLGVNAYRFSISWPRIEPEDGAVEMRGVAFYDRLVDELLERDIAPVATLYHWDLPQWAEDAGGWLVRDTAERFADHAEWMVENLGDRVHTWITLNEPVVAATFGYGFGTHAPGKTLLFESFTATHHLLLGHGLAVRKMRDVRDDLRIGITNNLSPVHPETDSEADVMAAESLDAVQNRLYMDPVLLGTYPDLEATRIPVDRSCVLEGDLDIIAAPLDVMGINYYNPTLVAAPGEGNPLPFELKQYPSEETTDMGWPVVPDGLRDILVQQQERYGDALPPVMVTENGVAFPDVLEDGSLPRVDDPRRVAYLREHIAAVGRAILEGVDVRGYFVWSLLDNFEWAEGYRPRFGIVYTDYPTQRRIPKTSFQWYREFLRGSR